MARKKKKISPDFYFEDMQVDQRISVSPTSGSVVTISLVEPYYANTLTISVKEPIHSSDFFFPEIDPIVEVSLDDDYITSIKRTLDLAEKRKFSNFSNKSHNDYLGIKVNLQKKLFSLQYDQMPGIPRPKDTY